MELKALQQFVNEMQATSSSNSKKEILGRYANNEFIKKVLNYTYHPFKQYYVTSSNLNKRSELSSDGYSDLFVLLDDLASRKITGHDALAAVNGLINKNPQYRDIILQVIDRNLKTRATETIINSVIPNCIPTFEVQLAAKYHEFMEKVEKSKKKNGKIKFDLADGWYASYKLDGCRCIGIVDDAGDCKFFSRGGNEFKTLDKVKVAIEAMNLRGVVFDGEICLNTADGRDDFQGVMKVIGKKDYTIENPKYYLFDFMPLSTFLGDGHPMLFSDRYSKLSFFLNIDSPYLSVLPQVRLYSMDDIERMKNEAIAAGREGLMLKRNTSYQQGRTNDILKVKVMHDAEYKVERIESDLNRVIRDGREVEIMMLCAVYIRHKGDPVKVGSGFTQEQKIAFHNDPSLIIDKVITVQYQEESVDQNGKNSLRFPVFKVLHGDKRTV